eukprot:5874133-Pleurochrysis_carterae.AAC.1
MMLARGRAKQQHARSTGWRSHSRARTRVRDSALRRRLPRDYGADADLTKGEVRSSRMPSQPQTRFETSGETSGHESSLEIAYESGGGRGALKGSRVKRPILR